MLRTKTHFTPADKKFFLVLSAAFLSLLCGACSCCKDKRDGSHYSTVFLLRLAHSPAHPANILGPYFLANNCYISRHLLTSLLATHSIRSSESDLAYVIKRSPAMWTPALQPSVPGLSDGCRIKKKEHLHKREREIESNHFHSKERQTDRMVGRSLSLSALIHSTSSLKVALPPFCILHSSPTLCSTFLLCEAAATAYLQAFAPFKEYVSLCLFEV